MLTDKGQIDYEGLVSSAMRDAMRHVIRAVMEQIAKTGLPGDHHFYISFDTNAPGVVLSKRLKERYPQEMTVVLQHRFWDLIAHADRFEVKLQFNSIPERLVVPYEAIKVFVDPSVRFGHQFDEPDGTEIGGEPAARPGPRAVTETATPRKRASPRRRTPESSSAAATDNDAGPASAPVAPASPPAAETPPLPPADSEPKVISLDKFRKK